MGEVHGGARLAVLAVSLALGCARPERLTRPGAPSASAADGGVAPLPRPDVDAGAPGDGTGIELAHLDASRVDPAVDPCVDFQAHVCGPWLRAHPIPPDQAAWGVVSNLRDRNDTVLRQTLEAAARTDGPRPPAVQRIGDAWAACMDEDALERRGLDPIRADLAAIDALHSKRGIAELVARLHRALPGAAGGVTTYDTHVPAPLFGFGPLQDYRDSALVVASIDQGGLGLPGRDFYLATDGRSRALREKYQAHVQRMLELAGTAHGAGATDAAAVLRIETALARGAMDAVKRREPAAVYNVRTLAQVRAATPSFDWATYLARVEAPPARHLIVTAPAFLSAMERALRTAPLSDWKAYLRWWTVHGTAPTLNREVVTANFEFYGKTLGGTQALRPRWKRCVSSIDRDLGEALGQAFVSRVFSPESRERALTMVHDIQASMAASIRENDWMGEATRREALAKLAAMEEKIGYPEAWRDYGALTTRRDDHAGNVRAAADFEFTRQLRKIGRPVDRTEWLMTPATIDAYNDPQQNSINFPAGILQPPLFEPAMGDAVYGSIGTIIGHEIVHGFDDQGRKYDAHGNLRDWWTPADAKTYETRGACFVQQYSQEVLGLGVRQDGHLTLGEDTADNGGLRLAYAAWQRRLAASGGSPDAKGPDGVTAAQRFFIAHAFGWCNAIRPEAARTAVATNPHSLPVFRVNRVVANSPEFAKAFGCHAGQPMVHENACRIW